MEKVGFRFHPTDFEIIFFYLMNLILGNTKLVEESISEINFYDHDPVSLPHLSRSQSDNGIYYFFATKQYTKAGRRKRSSKDGKWKLSGDITEIKDKKSGEKIGDKHVLVYEKNGVPKPKGKKSSWVMHEYQITHSHYHHLDNYVICKLFDKRDQDANITYGTNSIEPIHHQSQISDFKISPSPKVDDEQPGQDIDSLFRNDVSITHYQLIQSVDTFPKGKEVMSSNPLEKGLLSQRLFNLTCFDPWPEEITVQLGFGPNGPEFLANQKTNDVSIPMNIDQEDLSQWDYNYNNITNVQLQTTHYLSQADDEFLGRLKHVDRRQIEHLYHENSYGMSVNDPNMRLHELMSELEGFILDQEDLTMQECYKPMNVQVDYGFYPNM